MPSLNPSFGYFQLEQTEVCEKAEEHPHIPSAACGHCSVSGDGWPAGSELRFYSSSSCSPAAPFLWCWRRQTALPAPRVLVVRLTLEGEGIPTDQWGRRKDESSKSCQWMLGVSLAMFRVQLSTQTHAEDDPSNPASSLVVSSSREQGWNTISYSVLENFQGYLYQTWCKPLQGFWFLLCLKVCWVKKTYSSHYSIIK